MAPPTNLIPDYLINSGLFSVVVTDLEGNYTFVNQLFCERFSFIDGDFIGKPFSATVHEADVSKANEAAKYCLANPGQEVAVQLRKPQKQGDDFIWTNWGFSLVSGEGGEPQGILCIGYDLTEVKKSAKERVQADLRFYEVFNSSTDAYILVDASFRVVLFNEASRTTYGRLFRSPICVGADISDLLAIKTLDGNNWIGEILGKSQTSSKEVAIDGLWYQFDFCPVDGEQMDTVIHIRDIHTRKESEVYRKGLLASIPDLLFVLDRDGVILDYKADAKDLYTSPARFLNKHYSTSLPPDVSQKLAAALDQLRHEGEVSEVLYSLEIEGIQKHYQGRLNNLGDDRYIVLVRNVTGRVDAERKIVEQDKLLRAIYESTSEGISYVDKGFAFRFINQAGKDQYTQIFGSEPRIGASSMDYPYLTDGQSYARQLQQAMDGNTNVLEGWTAGRFWQLTMNPVRNQQREVIGASLVSKDLTETRQGQIKLQESERKYRLMVDLLSEGIVLHGMNGTNPVIDCNEAAARILGLTKSQLLGKDSFDKSWNACDEKGNPISPEQHPAVVTLRSGEPVRNYIMGVQKKAADFAWILVNSEPVFDTESGQLKNVLVAFSDITEIRNSQLMIESNEHRLQKIIESIPHPLLIVNDQDLIEFVNEDFTTVFGYDSSEITGKGIELLIPDRFQTDHRKLVQKYRQRVGKLSQMGRYIPARTKSGKELYFNGSLNSFRDGERNLTIVILQNVTEFKKNQETILEQNKNLKSIAWIQSHELRRPLANILGFCSLLDATITLERSEIKEIAKAVSKSAKEMDQLIHEIVKKTEQIK